MQNKIYCIVIDVLGEFSSNRADSCNYYLIKELDSMITGLIEVQRNAIYLGNERDAKICNGTRCVDSGSSCRMYKISKNISIRISPLGRTMNSR